MFQHLTLSGSPYERGRQHGEQAASLIEKAVRYYNRYSENERPELDAEAKRIEENLYRWCPETVEEMRGIAGGSGLPYPEILLLNVNYEVQARPGRHCTVLGLPDTADGPLIAKTDDVYPEERELETFYRVEPEQGYVYSYYAIAGTLWAVGGVNEMGLVQAMTGLTPSRDQNPGGIPSCIFLKLVLERCATTQAAIELSRAWPLLRWGHTLTLADPSANEIVIIEDYPTTVAIRRSDCEPLVQTNHCLLAETASLMGTVAEQNQAFPGLWENSHNRYENAARLAGEIPRSVEGLKRFLGDHSEPGAICQHGQANLHTSFAMILAPRQRAMLVAEGYGCETYREWRI